MADWKAFATAFLRDTAGYINERKDKAEAYKDQLMEQAERNKVKLSKLKQAAKTQQAFINQAKSLYATPDMIEAALDSGPTGLRDLVGQLSAQKQKYGQSYNESLVKDYVKLPEGFKATGDIDPMSRYGLSNAIVGDMTKPKDGFWASALGTNAKSRIRSELDAETFGDTGFSTYDLAQLSDVAGYESLNPTSFVSFTAPKLLSNSEVPDQLEDFNTALRGARIEADRVYDMKMAELEDADISLEEKRKTKEALAEARTKYVQDSMATFVDARRVLYDNYDELMQESLIQAGIPTLQREEEGNTLVTPEMQQQTATAFGEGADASQPEITVTELPPAAESQIEVVDTLQIKDTKVDLLKTPEGFQIKGPDGDMLTPEETKRVIDATQNFTYEQIELSYPDKEQDIGDVTAEEMNAGLTEPFEDGDPRPKDGMFASPAEKYRAKVWDSLYGETRNPDGTLKGEVAVDVDVEERPQDASVNLLKTHGRDIMDYMKESGLAKDDSDEEIERALADWFGENSTDLELPSMDRLMMPEIVEAIRKYLEG